MALPVPGSNADASASLQGNPSPGFTAGYRWYVVGMIFVATALNLLDRQILAILMEPIKRELGLSDTWLGFLSGVTFALFYATVGLPLARLADRASRRNIVALSLVVWSGMTALCGAAQNIAQLALARMGVGIGEAGCTPAAFSMVADYFPKERRSTALAFCNVGAPAGQMLGYLLGGFALSLVGWRGAFLVAGVPGIFIGLLWWLTVREPPRGIVDGLNSAAPSKLSLSATLGMFIRNPAVLYLALAAGFFSFAAYGLNSWMPSFLFRSYGMRPSQVGLVMAVAVGGLGGLGIVLGGWIADRLAKRDARWQLWGPALALMGATVPAVASFVVSSAYWSILLFGLAQFLAGSCLGPMWSTVQAVVPPNNRALAVACINLMMNLIGLGLGPQLIGVLSDALRPSADVESLRYALAAGAAFFIAPAVFFYLSGRRLGDRAGTVGCAKAPVETTSAPAAETGAGA